MKTSFLDIAVLLAVAANPVRANVQITEWMDNGNAAGSIGEFVELTNRGAAPVDMNGWSFDDDSAGGGNIPAHRLRRGAPGERWC